MTFDRKKRWKAIQVDTLEILFINWDWKDISATDYGERKVVHSWWFADVSGSRPEVINDFKWVRVVHKSPTFISERFLSRVAKQKEIVGSDTPDHVFAPTRSSKLSVPVVWILVFTDPIIAFCCDGVWTYTLNISTWYLVHFRGCPSSLSKTFGLVGSICYWSGNSNWYCLHCLEGGQRSRCICYTPHHHIPRNGEEQEINFTAISGHRTPSTLHLMRHVTRKNHARRRILSLSWENFISECTQFDTFSRRNHHLHCRRGIDI